MLSELDRDIDGRQDRGQQERPARDGVEDHHRKVLQPDKGMAGHLEIVVDERDDERKQKRIDRQGQDQQNGRCDQYPFEMTVRPGRKGGLPRRGSGRRHHRNRRRIPIGHAVPLFRMDSKQARERRSACETPRPAGGMRRPVAA
jgi:hypothetical protein